MNIFNSIKLTKVKKSLFDLTHDVKLTMKFGDLVPCFVAECLPGDKFQISGETLVRFAPLISPVMHRIDVTIHYFFVPNRILWPNWEKFITGASLDPNNPYATPIFPKLNIGKFDFTGIEELEKLGDYMGVPPKAAPGVGSDRFVSALPFAAYQLIWWEYYRDQNLIRPNQDFPPLIDGEQSTTPGGNMPTWWCPIRKRAWEHDYFTASLPWAQKGPSVLIPGNVELKDPTLNKQHLVQQDGSELTAGAADVTVTGGQSFLTMGGTQNAIVDPSGNWQLGGTINDLRKAYKLQEWLEKNARGGTRYKESNLVHFGVNSSDKRLQRPEYITGLKTPVVISEVLQTSGSDTTPQANMAGHGVAVTAGHAGQYFCEEHGYIMGIISIMPKTAYQQGIPRHFIKFDQLEHGWPEFAHLGEQSVIQEEIYAETTTPGNPFGYVPRFAEYKFIGNRVAGDFRTTLAFWHLGRIFASDPALNQAFVECDASDRVFAVEDGTDYLYVDVLNHCKALRPLPKYGNPGW